MRNGFTAAVALLIALWSVEANALETESTVDEDGWVVVSATLPHSKERVDAFLGEPVRTMTLGDGVRQVKTEPMANGCTKMHVVNNGFTRTLSYVAERCPVPGGWYSAMVSSEDFEQHHIKWTTASGGTTTLVTIRVKVSLKAPIPDFLVRSTVTKGLTQTLQRLDALLTEAMLAPAGE